MGRSHIIIINIIISQFFIAHRPGRPRLCLPVASRVFCIPRRGTLDGASTPAYRSGQPLSSNAQSRKERTKDSFV